MALSNQLFLTSVMLLLAYDASVTELSMVFLCDPDVHNICEDVITENQPEFIEINNIHIKLTGTALRSSGDFSTDVRTLHHTDNSRTILFVGIGNDHVVNAVSCIARAAGVPAVVYSTSSHRSNMYEYGVISIHPDHEGLARAILTVIGKQMVQNTFVICQDSLSSDGFLNVFRQENGLYNSRTNESLDTTISVSDSDPDLRNLLLNVHDNGFRMLIVHSSPELFERLVRIASEMSYFKSGYAWIITEEAMSYVSVTTDVTTTMEGNIPTGLLAVDGFEVDKYKNLLTHVIKAVRHEILELLKNATIYNLTTRYLAENFRVVLAGRKNVYGQFFSRLLLNDLLFGSDGRRLNMQYRLLNFIEDKQGNSSLWRTIGYIRGNDLDLNTVVWPGHSIFGPMKNARAFFSFVTRPAEPFLYVRGPTESRDECAADTECLKVFTYDPSKIHHIIESFRNNKAKRNQYKYEIHCCEGIVVDIIHALSVELKFDFLIYFQDDQNYGNYKNGTWTGMVGDVISGAADVMAGAVSITSERMEAITFTEAFYFASFSMVSGNNYRFTTLLAFMNPFDPYVWIMLVVSATSVAIITSLFEWNSPFGLNPWGKCRKKNYTLGSALTMVYSLWFGHTVKTKSPKSWPSKVLQNCWACLSIFVLAAYTANLAAFLAGNAHQDTTYSVLDAQLYSKRIGVLHTSAAEEHIRTVNPILQTRFRNNYLTGFEEAFYKLRNDQLDLYIDGTPILEFMWNDQLDLYVDGTPILEFMWNDQLDLYIDGTPILDEFKTAFQRLYKSINSEKVEPPAKVLLSKVKKRKFEIQSRIRQARSVPANLSSYELRNRRINHILDIAYKSFYETQNVHSDSDIYTISGSVDEEFAGILSEIDLTQLPRQRNSVYDISEEILSETGYDNPVFDSDDIEIVLENTGRSDRCESCSIEIEDPVCNGHVNVSSESVTSMNRQSLQDNTSHNVPDISRKYSDNGQNIPSPRRKERRYETWPSPQMRKRSVKRTQNNNFKSFSNVDRENVLHKNRIVNKIPAKQCRTCSSTSLEGLTTGKNQRISLNLKDNRLKSDIRNHAMAQTERRRSMAFDQGAVEALSKEDLLILWKRSEIDLQTRLNRMLHQNSHLRRLVHLAEEYQRNSVRDRTRQEDNGSNRKLSAEQTRLYNDRTSKQVDERTKHLANEKARQQVNDTGDEITKETENDRKRPDDDGKIMQENDERSRQDDRIKRQGNEIWQIDFEEDTDQEDDSSFIMTTRL
ncbi:uncharacterized protein LOC123525120 [Mercenaria mercenaria]|uniref:uncharacterized protein LOC123525120 n=1 Tax=Mercenaria mercenaria TaxID=6596 RepID=UPI00234E78AA|nr:uncharacterized protein LOC123525120 [Mercenaria mercenaria]